MLSKISYQSPSGRQKTTIIFYLRNQTYPQDKQDHKDIV